MSLRSLPSARRTTPRAIAVVALPALLLSVSACGGSDDSTAGDGASSDAPPPGLSFEGIQALTPTDRWADNPDCPIGQWDENPTGVSDELLPKVTFFRQLDCYVDQDQIDVGFPELIQAGIYVEFSDEAAATQYADEAYSTSDVIVDGSKVFTIGAAFDPDLAGEVAELCDCDIQEGDES